MLIRKVHAKRHKWRTLFPCKRSLGRVSVPMWGAFLSEPLSIVALVGRCPANKLMERAPIRHRNESFPPKPRRARGGTGD